MVKRIGMFACLFLVAVTLTACSESKEDKKNSNKTENKKENAPAGNKDISNGNKNLCRLW